MRILSNIYSSKLLNKFLSHVNIAVRPYYRKSQTSLTPVRPVPWIYKKDML